MNDQMNEWICMAIKFSVVKESRPSKPVLGIKLYLSFKYILRPLDTISPHTVLSSAMKHNVHETDINSK
jgi:hypothetical protein